MDDFEKHLYIKRIGKENEQLKAEIERLKEERDSIKYKWKAQKEYSLGVDDVCIKLQTENESLKQRIKELEKALGLLKYNDDGEPLVYPTEKFTRKLLNKEE